MPLAAYLEMFHGCILLNWWLPGCMANRVNPDQTAKYSSEAGWSRFMLFDWVYVSVF